MAYFFGNMSINGGGVGYDSANQSLSNLNDAGNARFTSKQDTLVSGENIKTINSTSILGEGNIEIGEGGQITVNQVYDSTSAYAQSGTAVAGAISTKANISLDNLSSNGQMVIDSQNGTISNCVLEIPQNLNLTLSNNVLTLKKGSVGVVCTSTYTTVTVANDVTITLSQADGTYMIFLLGAGYGLTATLNSKVSSGSSLPETGLNGDRFFNTTDKQMYYHNETEWVVSSLCYPVCLIQITSGVAGFVKFSDGRDCIFNGIGFVGQTKFIYPNVKVLEPIGYNSDGTLKSREFTINSLQLSTSGGTYNRRMFINGDLFQITSNPWYYDENTNFWYNQDNNPLLNGGVYLGNCFTVDGIVTDFTVRQPIKLVTNEMMEKKQDNITTITGYDATKTQTLKNISGVLTWVDD